MRRILNVLLIAAVTLIAISPWAWAADASGVWKSTSGNVFTIPSSSTDFDIVIKTTQGQKYLGHGAWTPGQVGRQFRYTVDGFPNNVATCTFSPNNPNTIRVDTQRGTDYWVRMR